VPTGHEARRVRGWLGGAVLAACTVGAACLGLLPGCSPPPPDRGKTTPAGPAAVPRPRPSPFTSPNHDDSGFGTVGAYVPPVRDPRSLEHLRDCYQGAGYRGIRQLQEQLASDQLLPEQRLDLLLKMARLYLYEGDFAKAAQPLEDARATIEAHPERLHGETPLVLLLQGVAALRRGEWANCVECACEASCIFPLQPTAYHRKPEGSRQAIAYFSEYLSLIPDDLGVRWLLNVAHMTLGEYPAAVPPQYLIPLEPFRSEFDVGRFTDVAPKLGLNRLHMSGGAVLDDFDNDGLLDLVETTFDEGGPTAFFRNNGDGTFADRSAASGLDKQLGGLYCVQTDYDNDGRLDLYVARGAWKTPMRHSLLRNNRDGTFTDVTDAAGLGAPVQSQAAAWADYDNDGRLDLFIGSELVRVNGRPVPARSLLYRNKGDGTFEEVAVRAGVTNEGFLCKGANWGDFDGDGFPDLFVANLNGPCRLFRNNRDGTFTDVARQLGVTKPHTAFSCWWFDYDNDGRLDLFVASFDRTLPDVIQSHLGRPFNVQTCRLYRNVDGRRFEDVTAAVGLERAMPVMGSNFLDADNDGWLDFYLATGDPNYSMLVPNRLFKNVQGRRFADITLSCGTGHLQKGHAVACGDWDRDGNMDLFVQLGGATPGDRFRSVLFQNPGHDHHWLTVKLVGSKTNRAAVGARIKAEVAGGEPGTIYRHVTSGSSFGGNALQQTIGLGKAGRTVRLEVYWPTSRTTQVFENVAVNQAIEVTEFDPAYRQFNWSRVPVPR
jgi:hypothetical protein